MNDKTKAELFEAVNLIDWHNQHGRSGMTQDQIYRLDELLDKWIHLRVYPKDTMPTNHAAEHDRIENEIKVIVESMRRDFPKAYSYNYIDDDHVEIFDKKNKTIATITSTQLNSYI